MEPLTIATLASTGSSILGSLLNQGPDTPDFVNPAIQAARRRRRAADRTMNRRSDRLEADIAASGMSGSGAAAQRESLYRANNDLQSNLDARLLDSINQARQQQEMAEYQAQQRKSAARAQAIGNLSGVAGILAANQFAGGEEQPEASQSVQYGSGQLGSFVDDYSFSDNPALEAARRRRNQISLDSGTQDYTIG